MRKSNPLKCADCGRIVPIADIDNGATHRQVDPSEDLWETLCKRCAQNHAAQVVIDEVRRTSAGV